ncbi:Hypothetical_protein [Hexamita inflata]|uniref:Hypothetical_protein n=1 Tax=Hexamita inflata TaxID=28002 RepID=A0ABP1GKV1_9EUKA
MKSILHSYSLCKRLLSFLILFASVDIQVFDAANKKQSHGGKLFARENYYQFAYILFTSDQIDRSGVLPPGTAVFVCGKEACDSHPCQLEQANTGRHELRDEEAEMRNIIEQHVNVKYRNN